MREETEREKVKRQSERKCSDRVRDVTQIEKVKRE